MMKLCGIGIVFIFVQTLWAVDIGRIETAGSFHLIRDGEMTPMYGSHSLENYDFIVNGNDALHIEISDDLRITLEAAARCYLYVPYYEEMLHVVLVSGVMELHTETALRVFASSAEVSLVSGAIQLGRRRDGVVGMQVLSKLAKVSLSGEDAVVRTPRLSGEISPWIRYRRNFDMQVFMQNPSQEDFSEMRRRHDAQQSELYALLDTVYEEAPLLTQWWAAYTQRSFHDSSGQEYDRLLKDIQALDREVRTTWMTSSLIEHIAPYEELQYEVEVIKKTLLQSHFLLKIVAAIFTGSL